MCIRVHPWFALIMVRDQSGLDPCESSWPNPKWENAEMTPRANSRRERHVVQWRHLGPGMQAPTFSSSALHLCQDGSNDNNINDNNNNINNNNNNIYIYGERAHHTVSCVCAIYDIYNIMYTVSFLIPTVFIL